MSTLMPKWKSRKTNSYVWKPRCKLSAPILNTPTCITEMKHAHMKLVGEHGDALESFDAELSQWLTLSVQSEQQHRIEADCSAALAAEVNQWLTLSEQVKPQHLKANNRRLLASFGQTFQTCRMTTRWRLQSLRGKLERRRESCHLLQRKSCVQRLHEKRLSRLHWD